MPRIATAWPDRLFGLDASRGIAAIAVVFWHWKHFAFVGASLPLEWDHSQQPFYPVLKFLYHLGWMGVEYFFVLSGFIFFWIYRSSIANRRVGATTFAVRRLARLYPLHIVTLVVVALLQYVYRHRAGEFFVFLFNDMYHFVLNMGLVQRWGFQEGESFNEPVWSVSIEVLLYVAFFFVVLLRRGGPLSCVLIAGFWLAVSAAGYGRDTSAVSLFFLGGAVFYLTRFITRGHREWRWAVYAVCAGSWMLTLVNAYAFKFALPLHTTAVGEFVQQYFPTHILFPSTVAAIALFEIESRRQFGRSLAWLGDISYSSYLLHFPLQLVLALGVAYGVLAADFFLNPVSILVFIVALVAVAYAAFHRFERPVQRYLRGRFERSSEISRMADR